MKNKMIIPSGHSITVADFNKDGDLDILGKQYAWNAPRLDIWPNEIASK